MSKDEILLKVITLGNSGVGKTSIINRYAYNIYDENNSATIGMNFAHKDVVLKNNKKAKLKLIDTAGEEKYRSLSKSYLKNADGVLFVFALNNLDSFNDITSWIQFFNENRSNEISTIYLIGNKCELECEVDEDKINDFLEKNEDYTYRAVSAAKNKEIDKLFEELAEKMFKNYKEGKQNSLLIEKEKEDNNKNRKCNMCTFNRTEGQ